MSTPRTPSAIAADARERLDTANKLFLPAPLKDVAELSVEFMESVAALLDAAGVKAPEQPSEQPAA